MLDLIYSGNMRSAWSFLDLMWPQRDAQGKADFRDAFVVQLRESPIGPKFNP
jgi:hypothetical protein